MSPIFSTIISIISIGAITGVLINTLKFIVLPHYRLEINRKKHTDDATAFLNYYENVYKNSQKEGEKKSKFEFQKLTNAAFGTKKFNYELIFLLFDRDVRDVEIIAKEIQKRWILVKIDYDNNKIRSRIKKDLIVNIMFFLGILYFSIAGVILVMAAGYEWIFFKGHNESIILLICFMLILIIAYFIYVFGSIKGMDKIIDWEI